MQLQLSIFYFFNFFAYAVTVFRLFQDYLVLQLQFFFFWNYFFISFLWEGVCIYERQRAQEEQRE